jgi:tetratricopeptide (TPR) repeat protein
VERLAARVTGCLVGLGVPYSTAVLLLNRPSAELVRATMEQESLGDLHEAVVRLVAAITDCGSVLLYDPLEEEPLAYGILAPGRAKRELKLTGVMSRAASSRLTQWVPDVRLDPDYVAADPMTRSQLALSLQGRPSSVAVLNCESPLVDAFRDDQIRWLEALIAAYYPASLCAPERQEAKALAEQARRAYDDARYDEAIELCTQALAKSSDATILQQRGLAYWYSHHYQEALADYDRVIAARGRSADWNLLSARGQVLVELERYAEALPDLDAAIEGVQGDLSCAAFMRRARAVAYGAFDRDAEAEEDFRLSRKGSPQNAWLDYSIAQYRQSRGASDEEVMEWYAAAIVRSKPVLNPAKMNIALVALRSLANLSDPPDTLEALLRGGRAKLLAKAAEASRQGAFKLSVVARAALYVLEPTLEHRAALAEDYARLGKTERARYHREAVDAARRAASTRTLVDSDSGAAASTDSGETAGPASGWLSGAAQRLFKIFSGRS